MKVLALVPTEYDLNPGQRYRIEQWEPLLREQGVEITYSAFSFPALSDVLYRPGHHLRKALLMMAALSMQSRAVVRAQRFDLVYIFREAALFGPAMIETGIAWQGIPLVYDFDDAIFVSYKSPSNSYLSYLKFFGKTAGTCRRARQVIVGNRHLLDFAMQYNTEVTIVPSTIDTSKYRPELRRRSSDSVPVIGWTGSYSTLQHLQRAFPALTKLAKRHRFRLVVVGTEAPEIPGVDVEFRRWSPETEVHDLADIDIGIMPLPDNPWSRGKCGLKALQYMALGIPPVISPVGVNTEIVNHGVNGFLAESEDEWVDRLSHLSEYPDLRSVLGRTARQTVEDRYSAHVAAPRVLETFERAVSEPPSAGNT